WLALGDIRSAREGKISQDKDGRIQVKPVIVIDDPKGSIPKRGKGSGSLRTRTLVENILGKDSKKRTLNEKISDKENEKAERRKQEFNGDVPQRPGTYNHLSKREAQILMTPYVARESGRKPRKVK